MTIRNDADKILREIWLRAAADPQGLRIDCKSVNTAKHYRMRLYRIAKGYRDGPNGDLELHEAVQMVSIAQPKDQWLVLVHTASAGLLGEIAQQLGFNPREADAQAVASIEAGLAKRLAEPEQPTRTTPYFTREG